ncbi:hypothetical protein EVAR_46748_1 [Eumeta japonica]|uniref:Uncharacterized protein n=1 Tax=Eumeta variegata TaxID=151549 RepID=A0A4C2ACW8_EUMVA|nr:hypothetical protein EVAR_46748_1 [Eumeta japonica]
MFGVRSLGDRRRYLLHLRRSDMTLADVSAFVFRSDRPVRLEPSAGQTDSGNGRSVEDALRSESLRMAATNERLRLLIATDLANGDFAFPFFPPFHGRTWFESGRTTTTTE